VESNESSIEERTTDLKALLAPRSVAVVGANDRPGSYADTVFQNLARAGFDGAVYGVNPKRSEVHGHLCVPTVADLPEAVDAVVVAIPAAGVTPVIGEIAARGCGGSIVFAAGFGEVESGRGLEAELRAAALETGLPVCGPNGNGVVAVASRAPLWGDSVPALEPGRVAMISQSGNVAVNAIGSRRGIRFHTLVSTGNQTVLDASDWLAALARTDDVGSVALFLEADGDGAKLAAALAECAEVGVGVAVLKVGASEAGARAAAAHTGALAGDQRVFRSLIEEAGGAWAADPHELLELAKAMAEPRARPRGGGVAILTCSGGDSGLAADEAASASVELPMLSPATTAALGELLPEAATIANPLDYTSLIWAQTDTLCRIAATVGDDPAVDLLLLCYDHPRGLSSEHEREWAAVREGLAAGALESGVAALFASTLPDLLDERATIELADLGIPSVAGLRTAIACTAALARPGGDPARLRDIAGAAAGAAATAADCWIAEAEAKRIVAAAGVEVPAGGEAATLDESLALAGEVGWPVALKLSGPSIQHKAQAGALALGLNGEDELRAAFERLATLPEMATDGASFLVERMEPAGTEVFVAARADGVVPALVVGLGGVWAEVLDDVAIVPLPATVARITAALASLRGGAALAAEPGGVEAVSALTARIGELLLDSELTLIELNPVSVRDGRAVALDAVARR
jgi:acyl-CoA synthetase (NDP forming)